jgi:spore cortex biosynthesis protein YabQ
MAVSEGIMKEAVTLGVSVVLGVFLFLLYDLLRIWRRLIPHGTVWIAIEDMVYWLISTVAVFVMLYAANDGKVRGYALGGIVCGMLFYYGRFSRLVIRINVKLLKPLCAVWKKICNFFRKQLKKAWKAFRMRVSKH